MHITSDLRRRAPMLFPLLLLLNIVPGLGALPAAAQSAAGVWRCGNHYTDQPCASGTVMAPAVAPAESARADADAATRRTRQQADAMARERERREADAAGRGPAVISHASPWEANEGEAQTGSRGKRDPRDTRAKRPRTEKGRSPQADGFAAKGPAAEKRRRAQ